MPLILPLPLPLPLTLPLPLHLPLPLPLPLPLSLPPSICLFRPLCLLLVHRRLCVCWSACGAHAPPMPSPSWKLTPQCLSTCVHTGPPAPCSLCPCQVSYRLKLSANNSLGMGLLSPPVTMKTTAMTRPAPPVLPPTLVKVRPPAPPLLSAFPFRPLFLCLEHPSFPAPRHNISSSLLCMFPKDPSPRPPAATCCPAAAATTQQRQHLSVCLTLPFPSGDAR